MSSQLNKSLQQDIYKNTKKYFELADSAFQIDKNELSNLIINYTILFSCFIISGVVVYLAIQDPNALQSNTFIYSICIIIPFLVVFGVLAFSKANNVPKYYYLFAFIIFFGIIGVFYYFSSSIVSVFSKYFWYFGYLFIALFSLIALTIIYVRIHKWITTFQNQNPYSGFSFFVSFLFYIPCLIFYLFQYLLQEYNSTKNITIILVIIEIILIIIYFSIYNIPLKLKTDKSIVFLPEARFLNETFSISNSSPMFYDNATDISGNSVYNITDISGNNLSTHNFRKNYAFSFWTYFNDYSDTNYSDGSANGLGNSAGKGLIFCYGSNRANISNLYTSYINSSSTSIKKTENIFQGAPAIQFDKLTHNYVINYNSNSENPAPPFIISQLPTQRWNYWVINYTDNGADLFINGELIDTCEIMSPPHYSLIDEVLVGEKNFDGAAICNVIYHYYPLSKIEIVNNYNINVFNNPPSATTINT